MQPLIAAPITLLILYRAYSHSSLTVPALFCAGLTATIHALHPSPLPFFLLMVFFVLGTAATKIKHDVKATLTLSSTGSSGANPRRSGDNVNADKKQGSAKSIAGGQEPRSTVQVLANSGCVSILCLLHVFIYGLGNTNNINTACLGSIPARDLILAGIVANYAAVTADTLSSELGILSSNKPRLITTLREVPPGTNGGVTSAGLFSGLAGGIIIGIVSVILLPTCVTGQQTWADFLPTLLEDEKAQESVADLVGMVLAIGAWGAVGSLLDSILGALLQASVVDRRSGKVVEAPNGGRVLISAKKVDGDSDGTGKPSRMIGSGRDILDNNQINFLMASIMTVGGMIFAGLAWEISPSSLWA